MKTLRAAVPAALVASLALAGAAFAQDSSGQMSSGQMSSGDHMASGKTMASHKGHMMKKRAHTDSMMSGNMSNGH